MSSSRRADLILVATTMLAASGWIFSKETIQGLPPFGFIGFRFVLASICLLPFCLRAFRQVHRSDIFKAMGVGVLLGISLMCWVYAISHSQTLGEGAFIMSLSMLFVPIVAWGVFKLKPSRNFWFSLPVAVGGLLLLALGGGQAWQLSVSQLWFLIAALTLAVHFNFNSKYASRIPTLLLTCLQLFVTGCMALSVAIFTETWPESVPGSIWGWFALSTLVATSLRYVMQTTGQKYANPTNAAIIMVLEPVWTVILSVIWYGEQMPPHKVMGCMMILLSLLMFRGGHLIFRRFRARA
ncbi:DMT family transporter [Photobacterium ganghwense]|uniref:DMT family transporter n=1 Tax=Photobacterium ganghwense TaxID=320778 RepID=UPI0039F01879